ncbi:MAG: hypothetical protein ACMVY4_03195 [Minwuia sp.]|uniref:hypothetical protein n=1 Tax=Minwuia sp. TaxID=2493630 RepID=UPI003A88524F
MIIGRRGFLISGASLVLAACAGKPPPDPPSAPKITFAHRPKLVFGVGLVDIQQPFVSPGRPPNVEHLLPNTPAQVAERWARDRVAADGSSGFVRYSILDASIVANTLETDKSLSGFFKNQNDVRYDGRIQVRIDVQSDAGTGFAEGIVTRSQTATEELSLNERDLLLIEFVEGMGRDLDLRLENEIRASLTRFLLPG